jgi:D-alanyl-D-alanine endopeptidase (penicillin-binding protein 7)
MKKIFSLIVLALLSCSTFGSTSVWLVNQQNNQSAISENITEVRPIASLTKLMTAMVILDNTPDFNQQIKLENKVSSRLPKGVYTLRQLMESMLIGSDNAAAEALAGNFGGGRDAFINAMNQKARALSMNNTSFDDPSGLSRNNTGTANDVGIMIRTAHSYEFIRKTTTQTQIQIDQHIGSKSKHILVNNTNQNMLKIFDSILVSKTGYTTPAGFCVGLVVERFGAQYTIVVLGAKNKMQRLDIIQKLMYNHLNPKILGTQTTNNAIQDDATWVGSI